MFAKCTHCPQTWTYEQLVEAYLVRVVKVPGLTSYPDAQTTRRLHATIVEYQKGSRYTKRLDPRIINAAYQSHLSKHTQSCFKKGNGGKSKDKQPHKKTQKVFGGSSSECRNRLPSLAKEQSMVRELEQEVNWYDF